MSGLLTKEILQRLRDSGVPIVIVDASKAHNLPSAREIVELSPCRSDADNEVASYPKRSGRTVAQDKREARKARNRKR